jgi:hypothetical protein
MTEKSQQLLVLGRGQMKNGGKLYLFLGTLAMKLQKHAIYLCNVCLSVCI